VTAMGIIASAIALAELVSPKWGLERARTRAVSQVLNAGYSQHGASRSKKSMVGWQTTAGGPDVDIIQNLPLLRQRSRDLFMGEGLANGAIKSIRGSEIGAGLQLNAAIDAKFLGLSPEQAHEWESNVEREFALWAGTTACDASRRCNFGELQALARLSQLVSGDVFALLPAIARPGDRYDLRVHLLEADRVGDPPVKPMDRDILGGVEVGPHGEPLAYWVADRHPNDNPIGNLRTALMPTWNRLPAFGASTGRPLILHLMESERPGQRRGVPLLAPVMEKLKQLGRYSDAELMAAVVSGYLTVAITTDAPQAPLAPSVPGAQQVATGNDEDIQLGNGTVVGLRPGEDLTSINPARPNAGFDPFVQAMCRQIGAGIGVPYEVLIKHFTSSYSASRGALLEFWKLVRVGRAFTIAGFCQPAYEQWLAEAVARGYVQAPGFFSDPIRRAAWCNAEWHGPTQGQLDPMKEVDAAAKRVGEGFSTRTQETRELTGGDFWSNHHLRAREEAARKADGLAATVQPGQAQLPPRPNGDDSEEAAS
jgi:lambda family phage portal protein